MTKFLVLLLTLGISWHQGPFVFLEKQRILDSDGCYSLIQISETYEYEGIKVSSSSPSKVCKPKPWEIY